MFNWFKNRRKERAARKARKALLLRVAEGLRNAAVLMNDGGTHWTQRALLRVLDDEGTIAYCANGGIAAAFGAPVVYKNGGAHSKDKLGGHLPTPDFMEYEEPPYVSEAKYKMAQAIGDEAFYDVTRETAESVIVQYNDFPGRTYQEVAAKLEEAAVLAERDADDA